MITIRYLALTYINDILVTNERRYVVTLNRDRALNTIANWNRLARLTYPGTPEQLKGIKRLYLVTEIERAQYFSHKGDRLHPTPDDHTWILERSYTTSQPNTQLDIPKPFWYNVDLTEKECNQVRKDMPL